MSDDSTKFSELKATIQKFCEERDWDRFHGAKDLAIGAATESSELLEIFRFQSEEQCEEMMKDADQRTKTGDELADVLFFVLRFAQKYGFDLSDAFARKMAKNIAKYPVEKAKGSNKKYTDL